MRVAPGVSVAVALLTSVLAREASAQSEPSADYVLGGALVSLGTQGYGVGVGGSFVSFAHEPDEQGVGAFLQVQAYFDGSFRFAAGVQANRSVVGGELGLAYRTGATGHAGTLGLHLAPFLSVGFVSFAWRVTVPLTRARERWETEHAFTAGFNLVTPLGARGSGHAYGCITGCLRPPVDRPDAPI